MRVLFRYNWQVRDDWFSWCESVPEEELLKPRVGGCGTFLRTLFHIVDVEQAWILQGLQANQNFITVMRIINRFMRSMIYLMNVTQKYVSLWRIGPTTLETKNWMISRMEKSCAMSSLMKYTTSVNFLYGQEKLDANLYQLT